MRKVVLYIAMSLDGYIADQNGGVQWLGGDGSDPDNAGSYPRFIETVDTIILGYRTYHQILTELSPDQWMYEGKISYIMTHRKEQSSEEVKFYNGDPADLISALKEAERKDIWVCGGASIVNQLFALDLIDRFHFTVLPTIQGDGVRLFEKHDAQKQLRLVSVEHYNGMVDLVYERRS